MYLHVGASPNQSIRAQDENRSPFRGVPLIDTNKFLDFMKIDQTSEANTYYDLPFSMPGLEKPFLRATLTPQEPVLDGVEQTCKDLVLASAYVQCSRRYRLSLADANEECILDFSYVPKSGPQSQTGTERPDYRSLKRARD